MRKEYKDLLSDLAVVICVLIYLGFSISCVVILILNLKRE